MSNTTTDSPIPSYRHAHWYFLAALIAIIAGFWPSFFKPMGAGTIGHTIHGVTATLWIVALIAQSWLMSRGMVQWHRRTGRVAGLLLLPVLCVSALYMIRAMMLNPNMPPFLPPLLAFIDVPSIFFLMLLVSLGLLNTRHPAAHKRFMSATVLLAFPPALTRLYARLFEAHVGFMEALHGSFITVEVILLALIASDWRNGERHLAYWMSLVFFGVMHLLLGPVGGSEWWGEMMQWYVGLWGS